MNYSCYGQIHFEYLCEKIFQLKNALWCDHNGILHSGSDPNYISAGENLSWFIRHLSDGCYIFYLNLWNVSSDIWPQPSELSDVSDVFCLHCYIPINLSENYYVIKVSLPHGHSHVLYRCFYVSGNLCKVFAQLNAHFNFMRKKLFHWWYTSECGLFIVFICFANILFNLLTPRGFEWNFR